MAIPFICIGAMKAGTTWLQGALSHHPEIWVPPVKELDYWNEKYVPKKGYPHFKLRLNGLLDVAQDVHRTIDAAVPYAPYSDSMAVKARHLANLCELFLIRDDASYRDYFLRHVANAAAFGEISPDYVRLPPEGIQTVFSDVRLLYILRDPVSRYWSQLRMMLANWITRRWRLCAYAPCGVCKPVKAQLPSRELCGSPAGQCMASVYGASFRRPKEEEPEGSGSEVGWPCTGAAALMR